MFALQVITASLCGVGLVLSGATVWRRTRQASPLLLQDAAVRPVGLSSALGLLVLVVLLLAPGGGSTSFSAVFEARFFVPMQFLAPNAAALVVLAGVPPVFRRRSSGLRVAVLRPRLMRDFVDRPVLLLVLPALSALLVLACALWQALSSVDVWDGITTTTRGPGPVEVSSRIIGLNPSWTELLGIIAGSVVIALATWAALRSIRDAAANKGGELTTREVTLRRTVAGFVLTVSAAAQTATAGLVLLAMGGFMQGVEVSPVLRVARHDPYYGAISRQAGVQLLEPEWLFATVEVVAGVVLLAAAAALSLHALQLVTRLTVPRRAAAGRVTS